MAIGCDRLLIECSGVVRSALAPDLTGWKVTEIFNTHVYISISSVYAGAIQRGMHVSAECVASLLGTDSPRESYWGKMPNHIRNRLNQSVLEPPKHLSEAYAGMAEIAEPIKV